MQEHNDQCRALVGKDYALITVRRYESCKRYLAELIRQKYGKDDLPLAEVNGELVRAFEFYLKTEKECQQNTVIRYMKCLKKITNLALANEWIAKDPFIGIKFHEKEVIREFLTMDELLTIYHKEFPLERITVVRDVFIFAAFTGLAFIDVQQLFPEHIVKDNNGNLWIRKPRQKTKNMCNIPLLDIPLEILRKYADYPACKKKGVLLPVPCNQKMNSYLKEIADLCLIKKNLTTHCSRHINSSYLLKTKNLQRLSAWQVTIWKPASFSILQCSASIKRTLFSFAKVVFFSFIAKVIPLKNRENQTSYHYCTFVAHLGDENQ